MGFTSSDYKPHITPALNQPLGFQLNGINRPMKQTPEQVKTRLEAEAKRMKTQEWHGQIWRPTITEDEKEQRKKQIDRGEIPF